MLAANPLRERLAEAIRQISDPKFAELLDELKHCIRQPNSASVGDFYLELSHYRFDREEANAR